MATKRSHASENPYERIATLAVVVSTAWPSPSTIAELCAPHSRRLLQLTADWRRPAPQWTTSERLAGHAAPRVVSRAPAGGYACHGVPASGPRQEPLGLAALEAASVESGTGDVGSRHRRSGTRCRTIARRTG